MTKEFSEVGKCFFSFSLQNLYTRTIFFKISSFGEVILKISTHLKLGTWKELNDNRKSVAAKKKPPI